MNKRIMVLAALALLFFMLVACNQANTGAEDITAESRASRRLIYGLTLAPSGIDPHVNASSELGIPLTNVYDTLVYQDPDTGEFVPGLAERWEISEDGQVYTFDLKQDVTFHDGTPFNAEAVRVNLERVADPDTASQKAVFLLGPYERTEILDDDTVQIHLREPYAPLLDALSQVYLGIASPAALEEWGPDYQFHQVGTGPFRFVEYVPNDHLTLARNPDYAWGPPVWDSEQAQLAEIEFRFFVDPATRAPALETGEVHVLGEIPPRDAVRLADQDAFTLYQVPIPGQPSQFFMNTQLAPLDNPSVRRALLYATDRQAIVQTLFRDTSPVAYGPLSAATRAYAPRVQDYYAHDPQQSIDLLVEAGWQDRDRDGVRERDGVPLQLTAALGGWGFNPDIAQLLQAQWSAIGIELQAEVLPYPALLEAGQTGSHHLIGFYLFGSDPDLLAAFYHSDGGFNFSHVSDADLDRWLEQGAATRGAGRSELYAQAQQHIMEQALVLPVRDYTNLVVADSAVQGLQFDAQGWFPWLIDVQLR